MIYTIPRFDIGKVPYTNGKIYAGKLFIQKGECVRYKDIEKYLPEDIKKEYETI